MASESQLQVSAQGSSCARHVKTASLGWWLRVLTLVAFIFQTNYLRFHLLSETHVDDIDATYPELCAHEDEHDHDQGDQHGADHHRPHAASDHLIQMLAKDQASPLAVPFPPQETAIYLALPELLAASFDFEHWKLPGESPPDPAQPRAPPLS